MSFIEKKSIGIDVADFSVEASQVSKKGGKFRVEKLARIELKEGLIERGRIKDEKKLMVAVKSLLKNAKPSSIVTEKIVFGLPESLVFTYVFTATVSGKENVSDLVRDKAENNIPINKEDLLFSFKVLEKRTVEDKTKDKKKTKKTSEIDILLIATSKKAVMEWQKFFRKLKIEIEIFDIETLATLRGMISHPIKQPVCILDIGSLTTNISIFSEKGLCYSYCIKKGGEMFTDNLSDIRESVGGKNLSKEQAEALKRQFGLSKQGKYGDEMHLILSNILRTIVSELKSALLDFNGRYGVGVKEVILVGGSAKLVGMLEYFQENLTNVSVLDQNVLKASKAGEEEKTTTGSNFKISLGKSLYISSSDDLEYIEVVGLAIRGLGGQYKNDPAIISVDLKKIEKIEIKKAKAKSKKREEMEDGKNSWIKEHKKEAQLIFVLIFGVIFIAGAFWYRDQSAKKKQLEGLEVFDSFKFEKIIDFKIPVAVNQNDYNSSVVRGRIFENEIKEAMDVNDAVLQSKTEAEEGLQKGEKLWDKALDEPGSDETIFFPITFEWLVYSDNDITALVMNEVKKNLADKKFMLSSVERLGIESGEDGSIYYIISEITVLTEEDISIGSGNEKGEEGDIAKPEESSVLDDKEENNDEKSSVQTSVEEENNDNDNISSLDDLKKALKQARTGSTEGDIKIKETATGWLNVRSGPGTSFDIVKKVYEGEKFFQIKEDQGWLEIDLGNDLSGWVYGIYVEK